MKVSGLGYFAPSVKSNVHPRIFHEVKEYTSTLSLTSALDRRPAYEL